MLTTKNGNKLIYILKAGLVSIFSSVIIGLIIVNIFDFSAYFTSDIDDTSLSIVDFLGYVIIAPVIETALMRPIINLIRYFTVRFWVIVFCSAFIWSCLHSLMLPVWGLFVFTCFVVFSVAYLTWEKRSNKYAYTITASIHALHNLSVCTALVF